MTERYPLPAHACSIWLTGDDVSVAFPSTLTEKGHTIRLPATEKGLAALVVILRDRATATGPRVGERGAPTQYEVERSLVHDRKYGALVAALKEDKAAAQAAREAAEAFLQELDL